MKSLQDEQVSVIKFLAIEGSSSEETYCRLKGVYLDFTIAKGKVFYLHSKFLKLGLLGNHSEIDIMEDNQWHVKDKNMQKWKKAVYNSSEGTNECVSSNMDELEDESGVLLEEEPNNMPKIKRKLSSKIINNSLVNKKICPGERMKNETDMDDENLCRSKGNLPFVSTVNSENCKSILYDIHKVDNSNLSCFLCLDKFFLNYSRLSRHLLQAHIKHAIVLQGFSILPCKKHCISSTKNCLVSQKAHYHCLYCTNFFYDRRRISKHYEFHKRQTKKHLTVQDARNDLKYKRSLCIDPSIGLYLVRKSKFLNNKVIHVRRKIIFNSEGESEILESQCSEEICQESMKIAKKNGNESLECKHLLITDNRDYIEYSSNYFTLTKESFELVKIKPLDQVKCLNLSKMAEDQEKPLVVEWVEDDHTIFFSVFNVDPIFPMGRGLVELILTTNNYEVICQCHANINKFCVNRTIAEIYFLSVKVHTC